MLKRLYRYFTSDTSDPAGRVWPLQGLPVMEQPNLCRCGNAFIYPFQRPGFQGRSVYRYYHPHFRRWRFSPFKHNDILDGYVYLNGNDRIADVALVDAIYAEAEHWTYAVRYVKPLVARSGAIYTAGEIVLTRRQDAPPTVDQALIPYIAEDLPRSRFDTW